MTFTYEWDRDQLEWRVYDEDYMEVASFSTLLEVEAYVVARSEEAS